MKKFLEIQLDCDDIRCYQRILSSDSRGEFSRLFSSEELASMGWNESVTQVNISQTIKAGTIRGLHYQDAPYAEKKLITCVSGEIQDYVVDIRPNSKNYLKTYSIKLTSVNNLSLMVPEGFAHGFQALTNDVVLIYLHSTAYKPEFERGLNMLDPMLQIDFLIPVSDVSDRDKSHPFIGSRREG